MEEARCPACCATIPNADLSAEQELAVCRACGVLAPLDTFINGRRDEPIAKSLERVSRLPKLDAWLTESDGTTTFGARSDNILPKMLLGLFALLFSVPSLGLLVLAALTSLTVFGVTPDGYTTSTTDDHGHRIPADATDVLILFVIALVFTLFAVLLWFGAVNIGAERYEVRLGPGDAEILSGKGRFAKKQPFEPHTVYAVADRITIQRGGENGPTKIRSIVLETANGPIELGQGLNEFTLPWMIAVLRDRLITRVPADQRPAHPRPRCPRCRGIVAVDSMNLAEGVAKCDGCSRVLRVEHLDLTGITERAASIDESTAPRRCSVQQTARGPVTIARQPRKTAAVMWIAALCLYAFMVPFALTGGAGLAVHFGMLPQDWLPMMGDGSTPKTPMNRGEAIAFSIGALFAFSLASWCALHALVATFGSTSISIDAGTVTLRHGIGKLAKSQECGLASIGSVRVLPHPRASDDSDTSICIDTHIGSIRFAKHLERDQQEWLATQLASRLPKPPP